MSDDWAWKEGAKPQEWAVQLSVRFGDHMANVRGTTTQEVMAYLRELRAMREEIQGIITELDGRPATEIAKKDWGARSQSRGSYAQGTPKNFSQKAAPQETPTGQTCQVHGTPIVRVAGGVSQAGKPYNASLRCKEPSHRNVVQWLDGEQ